jgi:NADH-quinone oxidoreductase subunit G
MEAVESLREELAKHESLAIVFGASVKGDALRRLVAFGDSLGTKVQYVCLVDYSNSRGAMDMGLLPELGPGYHAAGAAGATMDEMLDDASLDALWVVGANPLETRSLASESAFVVVHELFLTETAQRADVVFPAASAYEKNGTVTNTCGEVQRLKAGPKIMGTKADLEIMGLLAKEMGLNLGMWTSEKVFDEIRRSAGIMLLCR